jgi:Rieske Fe-S protein
VLAATVADAVVRVDVRGTALAELGGVARATVELRGLHRFLLLTRSTAASVVALNGTCTHDGCTVAHFVAPHFECGCHGSRFEWSGRVVRGLAAAALPRLEAQLDGAIVTVILR